MTDCIFCKIVAREIPAEILYEDDRLLAFRDVAPQAPTHILLIPKQHISTLFDIPEGSVEILGHLQAIAVELAVSESLNRGFRLVMNCLAEGGQIVSHLHLHLLGGRQMEWPPG